MAQHQTTVTISLDIEVDVDYDYSPEDGVSITSIKIPVMADMCKQEVFDEVNSGRFMELLTNEILADIASRATDAFIINKRQDEY